MCREDGVVSDQSELVEYQLAELSNQVPAPVPVTVTLPTCPAVQPGNRTVQFQFQFQYQYQYKYKY